MSAVDRVLTYFGFTSSEREERSWPPPWLGIVGAVVLAVVALQIGRTAIDASGTWPVLWWAAIAVVVALGAVGQGVDVTREISQKTRKRAPR